MTSSIPGFFTVTRTPRFSCRAADALRSLRDEDRLLDFTINVHERRIRCHRLVLCLHSPVLRAMILSDMAEGRRGEMRLDAVPYGLLKSLVDYMYWGAATFADDALADVVQACDFLQLLELRDMCIARAPDILGPGNALGWFKLASHFQLDGIREMCVGIITADFSKIAGDEEFLELSHPEVVLCCREASERDVPSDEILRAVFAWTDHDATQRVDHISNVLSKIQIENCSVSVVKEMMVKHSKLLDYRPAVFKLFTNSLINVIEDMLTVNDAATAKALYIIGGHKGADRNDRCWKLSKENELLEVTRIPTEACAKYSSVCATPDGFVVTGGENSNACSLFYVATQSWRRLKNMLRTRFCHGSVFASGILFVISEYNHGNGSSSMDYLTLDSKGDAEQQWIMGPSAPAALPWPKVTATDPHNIYVLDSTSSLTHLDVATKSWARKAPLPGRGWSVSVVSAGGRVLVAGGRNNLCCSYLPSTDTWIRLAASPALRHYDGALAAVEKGRKVVLLGGGSVDVEECGLEEDSPCWQIAGFKLPVPVKFHAAFEI